MNDKTTLRAPPLALDLVDQRASLNGQAIELGPKPFALLRVLMEAPQRLVTKEQIFESVWEGRFVSEAVLTTAIRDLRIALGDDARAPLFIATVHGKGYRFIQPVTAGMPSDSAIEPPVVPVQATITEPKAARRMPSFAILAVVAIIALTGILATTLGLGAKTAAAGTGEIASVAVLPFKDLSPQTDHGYFADGISEEILNVLRQVDGLETASRTSSFAYRQREELTAHQIGQALSVGHVLEGSVRIDGDKVRVLVSLIDTKSDRQTWSRDYERNLSVESMVSLESEIAERVVSELRRSLGAHLAHQPRERSAVGTTNLKAYDSYLRARELFMARKDFDRGIAFARDAVAADPKYARGWEILSATQFVANGGRATPELLQNANTALQLDPNLSLAHAVKGAMISHSVPIDWNRGFSALERAIELDPENTTALLWLGIDVAKLGYLERAQALLEKCLAIDPAYDVCRIHLAWTLHARGETDRALYEYRRVVREGSAPNEAPLLQALIEHGDEGEVRAMLKRIEANRPMPEEILQALRDPSVDRRPAVRELRAWAGSVAFPSDIYPIALELGAYDLHEPRPHASYSLWYPEYPELRRSEHFKWFVRQMEIDAYWREHGFPPQCRPLGEDDFACE